MPSIVFDFVSGGATLQFSPLDFAPLAKFFQCSSGDLFLDYSPDKVQGAYADSHLVLVQNKAETFTVPYQLLFDYRLHPSETDWGTVAFLSDHYMLPGELARHRTEMVAAFEKRKRLKKGNQVAVRVTDFNVRGDHPHYSLQLAHYFDQVGTNLSLDYPLTKPVIARGQTCTSVREWDIVQAYGSEAKLPTFENSRMANTLGVAVGISARSSSGHLHWLKRKRSNQVAVFANMWHLPFSFALSMESSYDPPKNLHSLIQQDLMHERGQELGQLEHGDFGALKPIALCRDLARGGKPQLFLELPCLVPLERLRETLHGADEAHEFKKGLEAVPNGSEADECYSPELACFLLLKED